MFARTVSVLKSGTTKRVRLYKIMDESASFSLVYLFTMSYVYSTSLSRTPATTNLSPLAPFCSRQINAVDLRHGDLRDDQLLKAWRVFQSQEGEMKDYSRLNDTNEYQVLYFHSRWVVLLEDAVDMDWCRCSQKALRLRGMNLVMTPFPPTGDSLNIKISKTLYTNYSLLKDSLAAKTRSLRD